ncbi:MAG: carbohydrate kinase [Gammaproteobacteria bacterium]|nr:carbohydrate kinase [Gammaproteobacteria bacterium]
MSTTQAVVVIGEVLFDQFDNGQSVLGGAPFNVAWHLQGFNQNPVFISRVGDDTYGEKIIKTMQDWGMRTNGVQLDTHYPTGKVKVSLNKGQPDFDICQDVAYDYIDLTQADEALVDSNIPVLYHGSLVARTQKVFDALLQFRQAAEVSFVDINLRPPWWNISSAMTLMQGANWLKVNDDELYQLTNCQDDLSEMILAARRLLTELMIDVLVLTRGSEGAVIVSEQDVHQSAPVRVEHIVDTVGAGDAFSSVCILGMQQGWNKQDILQRAAEFAAQVCQQQGATSSNHEMYQTLREKWQVR